MNKYLACPTDVHDELRADVARARVETSPVGVQSYHGEPTYYLRNCTKCKSTMAFEVDIDVIEDQRPAQRL